MTTITTYTGADGGSGIVEIYYLTPTAELSPSININNADVAFLNNTLNIDNAIGQRGIATFQTLEGYKTLYSSTGSFLVYSWRTSTQLVTSVLGVPTDSDEWPSNGDRIVFTSNVPSGIELNTMYYVVGVWVVGSFETFQISLTEGGAPITWPAGASNLATTWEIVTPHAFAIGQNIVLNIDSVPVWSGVIEKINKKLPTSTGIHYYIQGVSWNYALDKRRIVAAYAQTTSATSTSYGGSSDLTAGFIVEDLIDNYLASEGISTGTISSGVTFNSAVFNYIKPSQALDTLAEQSGYIWQINPDKTLDFKPHDSTTFSFNIGSSQMKAGSIQYNQGSPRYRNVQYVIGGTDLTSTQNVYEYGDAKKQTFVMPFEVMQEPTVYLVAGGTSSERSVGILGVDTTYQFYWNKHSNYISQAATDTPLSTAQQIHVEYIGGFPAVARVEDADAIATLQSYEGGSGMVEDAILRGYESLYDDNVDLAEKLITKYSTVTDTLKFKTLRSGISPGKILKIDLPDFGLSSHEFLVDSVTIKDQDGTYFWYDVTCLSGSEHGGWSRFFDDFLTRTVEKDIWEGAALQGDVLVVAQAFAETGSWTQVIGTTDFQCLTPASSNEAEAGGGLYPSSSNETHYPC